MINEFQIPGMFPHKVAIGAPDTPEGAASGTVSMTPKELQPAAGSNSYLRPKKTRVT